MPDKHFLFNQTVHSYLDDLSSSSPTPGGGAVAALTAAQGFALISMAIRVSINGKSFDPSAAFFKGILDRAINGQNTAAQLAEDDAAAFEDVLAAYRVPQLNETQRVQRRRQIDHSLLLAAEVPYRLFQLCSIFLPAIEGLELKVKSLIQSDVTIGRELLKTAKACSAINTNVNLNLIQNPDLEVNRRKDIKKSLES